MVHIVTYSWVLFSRWKRSRNTHSYRIPPTGPLVAIFQHSFQFLQSENFQTHVGTIHHRAIGSLAHHNSISAYSPSLTCHLPAPTIECLHRLPYRLTCFSHRFPDTTARLSSNNSQTTLFKSIEVRRQQSRYYGTQLQLVYIVAWQLKARPPIIVAYLRKPRICNNIVITVL
jgi:hypothetical protein